MTAIRGLNGLLYQWMGGKEKNTEKANLQMSTDLVNNILTQPVIVIVSVCVYFLFDATV